MTNLQYIRPLCAETQLVPGCVFVLLQNLRCIRATSVTTLYRQHKWIIGKQDPYYYAQKTKVKTHAVISDSEPLFQSATTDPTQPLAAVSAVLGPKYSRPRQTRLHQ
eukprot:SAG31_NODE_26659_length_438_cov_1.171091_1_plen_106_part_10